MQYVPRRREENEDCSEVGGQSLTLGGVMWSGRKSGAGGRQYYFCSAAWIVLTFM